jgi:two-component system osmolarity sensor histidine kinase EnvZ
MADLGAQMNHTMRRALLRWSALLVNMLLIGVMLTAALGLSALAFYHFVQRPRAEMLADMFAAQLASVSAAVTSLPPAARDAYLQRLDVLSEGSITIDDHAGWRFVEPDSGLAREFLGHVRRRLSGNRVYFSSEPTPQLWLEIAVADDHPRWIRMPLSQYASIPTGVWLAGVLAFIALVLGGAAYLLVRSRRKFSWLRQAIDQIGTAPFPDASAPALVQAGNADVADLGHRFNQMSNRLADAHAERELMLAGVSHDMRTLLTKLRLSLALEPAASALAGPVRYIENMDRIIGQFLDFGRPVDEEPAMSIDLNELVADVAADFAPEAGTLSLALGAIPPCLLRPLAVRRMVMNLVENSMRHGGPAVEVTTALEHDCIVLRVLDRGPGVSAQELSNLTRPFFRTPAARSRCPGSGLGLAISRRMAESHDGTLVLALRKGGGFKAEVRLPARFPSAEQAGVGPASAA